jgi:hypothetical protein
LPYLCPKDEDFCGFLANMYSTTDWESFNQVVCDFCRQLRDKDLDYRKPRNLELIALAARWAELILKYNIDNN